MSRVGGRSIFLLVAFASIGCSKGRSGTDAASGENGSQPGAAGPSGPVGPDGTPTGIRVLDFHTHFDPRASDLVLQKMDRAGVAMAMNFSGGSPTRSRYGDGRSAMDYSVEAQKQSKGRLRFFCVVPWSATGVPDFVGQVVKFLRECKEAGGLGVKISKALGLGAIDPMTGGLVRVDDPWLDPIFEEAGRLGLPVAMHTGDPKAFFEPCGPENERYEELTLAAEWCFADQSQFPTWEDLFGSFMNRVGRHPGTTFVGAHFGNDPEEPLRIGKMMREHPNLWIDTAARVPEIGRRPADTRAVFDEFPDRIVFGTDLQIGPDMTVLGAGPPDTTEADFDRFWRSTWRFFETTDQGIESPTPIQGRWTVTGIGLGRDVLEKVYHGNAERLLGL
ncbi:MAG: amidohydrolase [Acidobacteria bacterium]|nr:amidohydrolase [Acidobacteriota bacterium]